MAARGVVTLVCVAMCVAVASAVVSDVERDVLKWLNVARTTPAEMAKHLELMLPNFDATTPMMYHIPNDPVALMTSEGKAAVVEAANALKASKVLPALTFADGLLNSAQDHADDQGRNGVFSHTGTDGTNPWARIGKYGKWKTTAAENMGTGFNSGIDIVRQLLVDDGEPDRGHRKNILNGNLTRVGVATRPHTVYDFVTVMDFTGVFTENPGIRKP